MPFDTPGVGVRMPVYAACSTSLAPIQIVTNVGRASRARWTWVFPPRMIVVRAFDATVLGEIGSSTRASGTPTLFSTSVTDATVRTRQVVGVDPVPTRAWVWKLLTGGGHPGAFSAA